MKAEELLFLTVRFAFGDESVREQIERCCAVECLDELLTLSKYHDLAHVPGEVLGRLNLLSQDTVGQAFKRAAQMALVRHMKKEKAVTQVCEALEAAEVPFVLLKGTVLRAFYPQPWMRTSCDIDVLVKEADLETAMDALETRGFERKERSVYDVSFFSPQGVHVELHFLLITDYVSEKQGQILSNLWEQVVAVENGVYQYKMPDELFYFYHMAHMAKHMKEGGCGIRSVLDVWILNNRVTFDANKRYALLEEGELLVFAKQMEHLAEVWLTKERTDDLTESVSAFILKNGTYGTYTARIDSLGAEKNVVQYATHRIFLPYQELKYHYPVLQKHKWLLPVYEVRRWGHLIASGGIQRAIREFKTRLSADKTERKKNVYLMKSLALRENTQESNIDK